MRFLGWGGSDQPGEAVNSIVAGGVIAIVRLPSADVLVPAAEAIREGGVAAIEVTPTTPGAVQALGPAGVKLGRGIFLGLGSVLTPEAARDAIRAGAAAVGVGDEIVSKDLLAQREFSEITRRARAFAEAVQRARGRVERPPQPVRPIEGPDTRWRRARPQKVLAPGIARRSSTGSSGGSFPSSAWPGSTSRWPRRKMIQSPRLPDSASSFDN
jgi:hypothetical protein